MNVSAWCIRNPIATIVFFVVLTIGGIFAFRATKVQLFPDIDLPMIIVTAAMPGAQPEQMESEVARKMENAIAGVQGLRHIYTTARAGLVTITAEFRLEKPGQEALDEVRQAVNQIRASLPTDMEEPVISKINVAGTPIVAYTIASTHMDEQELSWFVDDAVTKKLLAVPGVGSVARVGGARREIAIELDSNRLQALGMSASEVSSQLRQLQTVNSAGSVKVGGSDQVLRTQVQAQTAQDLAALPISTPAGMQTLGSLAAVRDGVAEVRNAAYLNGKPVVSIEISRSKNASDIEVGAGVQKALEQLQAQHPDIRLVKAFDFYTPIEEDFKASMNMLWEGALLAVFVVWLFLRDWRATLVSATALPLSVLPAMLGLWLAGYTFNVATLLALSLVIGILVDDAIVEVENIVRHMRMGKTPLQAAIDAADEIGLAVIATTFTIIAVFLPTAFMTGIPGKMFKQFSLTAVFAVFASLVVARMLTPMMAAYVLKDKPVKHDAHNSPIMQRYMRLVTWCIEHRLITCLLALAFFVASLLLVPLLSKGFIPPDDNSQTQVRIELQPGTTLEESKALAEYARQRILEAVPEVKNVYTAVGGGKAGSDGFVVDTGSDPRSSTLTITLADRGDRPVKQVLENRIRQAMEGVPGARIKVGLGGSGENYWVMLKSDDPAALATTIAQFEKELRTLPGVGNIASTASLVQPEIVLVPKLDKAADLGVNLGVLAHTLRIATVGDYSAMLPKLNTSQRQVPIVVKLDQDARTDLSVLGKLSIPSANGPVMLDQVVDMKLGGAAAQIDRYDRSRNVQYSIELNGVSIGDASEQVLNLPSIKNLPPSVQFREVGDAEVMADLFRDFSLAMGAGVLCIYLVLILLFKNLLHPFTILIALPLSIGGAFVALLLSKSSLSMPSMIGLLMLMGVTTKNSILLVEYAIVQRREHAMSRKTALLDACRKRAMPIVMTTIAMAAGMLPVAMGWSAADQSFRAPMAWTVIGGLVTSTILSLLVIPAAYQYMDNLGQWFLSRFGGLAKTSASAATAVKS